jgi:hypothetical protein
MQLSRPIAYASHLKRCLLATHCHPQDSVRRIQEEEDAGSRNCFKYRSYIALASFVADLNVLLSFYSAAETVK